MEEKIKNLISTFKDLRFDSLIFIFGFGGGEYLEALLENCCERNVIYIIEPDIDTVIKYKNSISYDNIFLIPYNEDALDILLRSVIHSRNYVNIFVDKYGDYAETYKEQYIRFIELIDESYYRAGTFMYTTKCFKKVYLENILSNINHINESTPLDLYKNYNEDIPAIIVSAGPSLDKNIDHMLKFKDRLDKFFIVAGNRTIKPLLQNGIKPDLIVSIDPQEISYNMMGDYVSETVPLVFYEQSNRRLVNEYKGDKIYTTQGLLNNIQGLSNLSICYSGGSVAHCSTDIAVMLGCNPIIFVGQDFGYTFEKHHATVSSLPEDKEIRKESLIKIKDVFGKEMLSDSLLNLYKKNMEFYIRAYSKMDKIEFINSSYGANIEGAVFRELKDVLTDSKVKYLKKPLEKKYNKQINIEEVRKTIIRHIDDVLLRANSGIKICDELVEGTIDEQAVERFYEALKIIDDFVKDPNSLYFKGYLEEFLFDIKEKYFKMTAKEYPILTSNLTYQSKVFSCYFKELIDMLNEVKKVIEG